MTENDVDTMRNPVHPHIVKIVEFYPEKENCWNDRISPWSNPCEMLI
jgi:hypothetical protein